MPQLYINNFQTIFIASVKSSPTSANPATELDFGVLRVSDGAAGQLINPSEGDWYILTGYKREGTLESNIEIVRVTAVDNSVVGECRLTVLRGQDGTTPQSYEAGDLLEMRITAGGLRDFAQNSDPRFTNPRPPSGAAGGVLSGTYPNPGFAQAMATSADLTSKVDKVAGKGLSANDYTNADLTKLAGIAEQATKNATDAQLRDRATHTGTQPIASVTGLQTALDAKVDKVVGKDLSTEDYTTADKSKLAGISAGATANSTDAYLLNRVNHTGVAPITGGGTGANNAATARTNLGLGSAAVAPIVGTVSQSGGVPTGAIIQRGSNANGEFVRYADGSQECWKIHTITTAITNTDGGSLLYSGGIDLGSFPAAFSPEAPSVNLTVSGGSGGFTTSSTTPQTTAIWGTYYLTSGASRASATYYISCHAKGRWF